MRRVLLCILAALIIVSCSLKGDDGDDGATGPAGTPPSDNVFLVDSAWTTIRSDYLIAPSTSKINKSITSTSGLESEMQAHNAAHTDDQYRIIYGTVPDISVAPPSTLTVIRDSDHYVISVLENVPRSQVAAMRASIEATIAKGNTLYVDCDPPEYIPPSVVSDYVKYALYLIDASGAIQCEDHCEYISDYPSKAYYFERRKLAFESDAAMHPGWYVKSGELYTEP